MEPVPGSRFLLGDCTCVETQRAMLRDIGDQRLDLVLSDISPNRSGIKGHDHARIISIFEEMLLLSRQCLRPGGSLVAKLLHGGELQKLMVALREFSEPSLHKPPASRKESAEVYVVARNFDPIRFDKSAWLSNGLD